MQRKSGTTTPMHTFLQHRAQPPTFAAQGLLEPEPPNLLRRQGYVRVPTIVVPHVSAGTIVSGA